MSTCEGRCDAAERLEHVKREALGLIEWWERATEERAYDIARRDSARELRDALGLGSAVPRDEPATADTVTAHWAVIRANGAVIAQGYCWCENDGVLGCSHKIGVRP